MKFFGREPTIWLQLLSGALGVIVAIGDGGHPIFGLTATTAGLVMAVIAAIFGAINAAMVRPIAPAAFQMVLTTVFPLLAAYGVHVAAGLLAALQTLLLAVIVLLTRGSVTPAADPANIAPAAGQVR